MVLDVQGKLECLARNVDVQYGDIKGVGIDIVSVAQIANLVEQFDCQSLALLFTPNELDWCQSAGIEKEERNRAFALCFATKEAVSKALTTGLVGIEWTDIEAYFEADKIHNPITVMLSGAARVHARNHHIQCWQVNWWEWDGHVMVHVLSFLRE
ncbi:holo-ACP synthase [Acaryochloris marina]|uniref:Holo-acyl-carrier-protein synthase n=1 Tax=Acaryochloris marina (strain MBIC 11017) TaxID=329726 RepID=A8ZKP7_ACAM1|nr:4'-phosphopantetheinyl transferase superfamily protein [Acaryochloris marina]ABW31365.1 holo-acyl-carrier-protein synthase [Acaryochloris marina MBIC11017]